MGNLHTLSSRRSDDEEMASTIARGDKPIVQAPRVHVKTYLAVFTICLIYYAQLVNLVGAGAQTQTIAAAMGASGQSVWISSPLAIMTAVLSPVVSQAADFWGRRWLLVGLTSLGAVGSIVVSRAETMGTIIAGFTITGFSYGAQPLLHAISSEVLPRRYRPWGQAADLVASGLGGITALLVGGALNRYSSPNSDGFRYFWYMTAGIFAVAALLTVFLYNPPPTHHQLSMSQMQKLRKLDWIGYLFLTAGLVLICVGLSWSENPYQWSNAHVSASFAVGLLFLVLLCVYETIFKRDGMFHHDLFRNRNFPITLACIFCEGIAFFAANQYFAFEVGVLYTHDSLVVGARYSIALAVSLISALATGYCCYTTRRVRWISVLAFVILVAFFAAMAASGPDDSLQVWIVPILLGIGLGMSLCALITASQLSTPAGLIAITSGLIISIRSFGGGIGLAIYNAIFVDGMNHLGDNVASAVLPLGLNPQKLGEFLEALTAQDFATLSQIPGVNPEMIHAAGDAVMGTYATAFRNVWIAAGCFAAVGAILAAFLKDSKDEFSMLIDAPVEREEELYELK